MLFLVYIVLELVRIGWFYSQPPILWYLVKTVLVVEELAQ
jgi:hypothetical protein